MDTRTERPALGIEVQPDDDYFQLLANVSENHWWHRVRRKWLAQELQGRVPRAGVAIDVGTGMAESLPVLRALGARTVVGTDYSMQALRYAHRRKNPPAPVLSCLAEQLPFGDDVADVLISMDVIEHLDDDVVALRDYRRVVKDGGSLFLTVPAYQFLWSDHDVSAAHRRRYTAKMLRTSVERAGFTVVRVSYFYSFLVPLAVLTRRTPLKRLLKETDEESSSVHPALDRVFYAVSMVERDLEHRGLPIPFGLSIFCLAI